VDVAGDEGFVASGFHWNGERWQSVQPDLVLARSQPVQLRLPFRCSVGRPYVESVSALGDGLLLGQKRCFVGPSGPIVSSAWAMRLDDPSHRAVPLDRLIAPASGIHVVQAGAINASGQIAADGQTPDGTWVALRLDERLSAPSTLHR
jgi:hypothetical protein